MYKEAIIENVDAKKEEAKKAILAKFVMDEETAQLAVDSAPLELLNDLDRFIQVLDNFIIDKQTQLLMNSMFGHHY